jgi:G3E family GTPase
VKKQLDAADVILLSKEDIATAEQAAKTKEVLDAYKKTRQADTNAGVTPMLTADVALHSLTLRVVESVSSSALKEALEHITPHSYRVKGFVKLSDGAFYVDCVGESISFNVGDMNLKNCYNNLLALLYGHGQKAKSAVQDLIKGAKNGEYSLV